jgi:hypothetical protein
MSALTKRSIRSQINEFKMHIKLQKNMNKPNSKKYMEKNHNFRTEINKAKSKREKQNELNKMLVL